jgi:hypothetical protein
VSIGSGLPIIDFLTVAGAVNSSAGYRCRQGSSGAVSNLFNIFYTSNTAYLYIDTTNIGAFSYASDERVKQDITDLPITGFIDRVSQMRVINYQWADAGLFKSDGVVRQGFSANNLYAIKPGLVDGTPDGLTEDGKIQPMTINTTSLLSEVVGALKEATEVIQALSSRVAALEAK